MHVENPMGIEEESHLKAEICRVGKEMEKSGLALFLGVYAPGNIKPKRILIKFKAFFKIEHIDVVMVKRQSF